MLTSEIAQSTKEIIRYESVKHDKSNTEFKYGDYELVKVGSIFSKELIEDIHSKTGNDDLTEAWDKRTVRSVY
ncbi:hypothetical protein [Saliterribacillus persicus]|uniref:hypothetical protein n=1 Tax=Saliterribacillus persicus TaxID=930114 RepID=UPI000DF4A477|nr:hypothetical protein [Saliterribacillus persicus]